MKVFDSRKVFTVAIMLLISSLAVNGASSKETAVVKDVSFTDNGQSLEVKITATEEAKFTYFELDSPHRLVVDFHGIQGEVGFREKQIGRAGVKRIRTSLFNDKKRRATRLVFDLAQNVPYEVRDDDHGIVRIVFGDAGRAPMNLTAGPVMVPEEIAAEPFPNFPTLKVGSPLLRNELSVTAPQVPQEPGSSEAVPPSPVAAVAAAGRVLAAQTRITVAPPTTPSLPLTNPPPAAQYSGEIISLDLKDIDIKDFFRLISEVSGLNVVLDPAVQGTVTIVLNDVPWDQALDIVLRNYQLGGELQGNVLRIATQGTLTAEQNAQRALRDAADAAAEVDTRTHILNYTKAETVAATLQQLLSPRGRILQDVRRNALIISDIPSQFTRIDQMIRFLDTPAQQVEIEARLLSANKSFSREIGNQLGFLIGQRSGNILTGAPGNPSPFERTPAPRATDAGSALPLAANFPAAATSGLSFFIHPGADILLDEIITAAEARGTAKLISRPKVVTQNNQAAVIQQGTQIPVQSNVNNTVTVQFLAFTLQLSVTPQITEAGTILLNVTIENSQPDFARAVNGIPSVATQRAQTTVLIPDGGTAAIGGILIDSDSVNVRQVPGLGSLPVIGHLFKNTSTVKSTAELLFFITPRIKPQDAISGLEFPPPPGSEPKPR